MLRPYNDPAGTRFRIECSSSSSTVTLSFVTAAGPSVSKTYNLSNVSIASGNAFLFFGNSAIGTAFSDFSVAPREDTTPPTVTSSVAPAANGNSG